MNLKQLSVAVPAALLVIGSGAANAGQTINEAATMACVNDKWDEKEPEKGHKLVDFAGRCINVPNDPAAPKSAGDCVGKYEYMPDESWKGSGTCTYTFKGGDTLMTAGKRVHTSRNTHTNIPVAPENTKVPAAAEPTCTRI